MMKTERWTRRNFLATSSLAAVALAAPGRLPAAEFKTKLHKALIGDPTEELLTKWKAAGLEGIESNKRDATPEQAAAAKKIAVVPTRTGGDRFLGRTHI